MRYQFDDFQLDTDQFELRKGNQIVHTEPQVIELLGLLVEHRNRMLSKDELLDTIWRGKVVSESALSSRIKLARHLIDDDGHRQRYIRTIHRKGFRFVGEVKTINAPLPAAPDPQSSFSRCPSDTAKPVIAVLPFTNRSSDKNQEYFADGMTDDIISQLAKHRWLNTIARNTMFGHKHQSVTIQQLHEKLGAHYVIDGSVQRIGERIRIKVQLNDALNDHTLWSEHFDRELDDIFAVQDEITRKIVARLEPEIGFAERSKVIRSRPASLETWDCFHLGIYHFYRFTGNDNLEAQRLLLESQKLDPNFGEAHAWWAYALILGMVYWDTAPNQTLLDEALSACDRALCLDDRNATFHALRARVLLARQDYRQAISGNEMAISLNPTFAAAYCGMGDSLAYEKRYDEAMGYFEKAIALSPNDPQLWAFYTYGALALLFQGDYEKALLWTQKASSLPNCQYWTTAHAAIAMSHLGAKQEATLQLAKLCQQMPQFCQQFVKEKLFYLKEPEHVNFYLASLQELSVR